MIRLKRCTLNFCFVISFLLALGWAGSADAIKATFRATIDGETRTAILDTIPVQNVSYVSLSLLTQQFGGSYNIQQIRTQVDIAGASASVYSNDDEVSALSTFSLSHPILRRSGDVLIATADVPLFFDKGFRVTVEIQARTQAIVNPGIDSATILRRPIRVIIIDPGHGGRYEPGVTGQGGVVERDITLAVSLHLQQQLSAIVPQTVLLTRKDDTGLSLKDRVLSATDAKGDLLISIHCGGSFSPDASGLTLYYPPQSSVENPRSLLRPYDISKQSEEISLSIARSLTSTTSATVDRIQSAPCTLLTESAMPGVLIEIGYLTNATEESLLRSRSYQERIAQGIASGIATYLSQHDNERRPVAARSGSAANAPGPAAQPTWTELGLDD